MTRNHKAISFAMALVFCLSFMAPLFVAPQAADAACTLNALSVPTVQVNSISTVGSIRVVDTLNTITTGSRITITLVGGNEWGVDPSNNNAEGMITADTTMTDGDSNRMENAGYDVAVFDSMITMDINALPGAANSKTAFDINFGRNGFGRALDIQQSGDIIVGVAINGGVLSYTEIVVGKTGTGATTTKGLSHPNVAPGPGIPLGDIQISENIKNAITAGTTIAVTLPDGIRWAAVPDFDSSIQGPQVDEFGLNGNAVPSFADNSNGLSELQFSIATGSDVAGFIVISNILANIDEDFDNGDIEAKVKKIDGDGVTSGTAWIGVKGDYTITVEQGADTIPTIYKGQSGVEPGTILITESTALSLVDGRSLTATLPSNCYWSAAPEIDVKTGSADVEVALGGLNENRREASWTIDNPGPGGTASVLSIEGGEIAVRADADEGSIDVVIGGHSGAEGTVTIGTIASPITVTVDPVSDIIIGLKSQGAGTITITEAEAGLLMATVTPPGLDPLTGDLILDCPEGVTWASEPTVEATAGDIELDVNNITRAGENNQLEIPVDSSSEDTPAVITISGVTLTSTRIVPEGTIVVGVRGPAIDEEYYVAPLNGFLNNYDPRNVTTFVLANCVTPAPSETVAEYYATFSLGSTIYYVNGLAKMMDVACFAQDNRMFVPQRYLGYALGVSEENIVWDSATQTATFTTNDGKVATCVVGSNILTFDGVETTMDVKPLVVDNRIFLPARFLTEAMGGSVGWDQATQTAFVNIAI